MVFFVKLKPYRDGQTNLFVLKNEIYKPHLQYTTQKLNEILESLLHQRAMQMDSSYADSVCIALNIKLKKN